MFQGDDSPPKGRNTSLIKEPMPSDVATWLAIARKQKNLSQARLAEQVGVGQAQVSQWETGKLTPNEGHLAKLHALLGAVRHAQLDQHVGEAHHAQADAPDLLR